MEEDLKFDFNVDLDEDCVKLVQNEDTVIFVLEKSHVLIKYMSVSKKKKFASALESKLVHFKQFKKGILVVDSFTDVMLVEGLNKLGQYLEEQQQLQQQQQQQLDWGFVFSCWLQCNICNQTGKVQGSDSVVHYHIYSCLGELKNLI
jgi:hypothetical protein